MQTYQIEVYKNSEQADIAATLHYIPTKGTRPIIHQYTGHLPNKDDVIYVNCERITIVERVFNYNRDGLTIRLIGW